MTVCACVCVCVSCAYLCRQATPQCRLRQPCLMHSEHKSLHARHGTPAWASVACAPRLCCPAHDACVGGGLSACPSLCVCVCVCVCGRAVHGSRSGVQLFLPCAVTDAPLSINSLATSHDPACDTHTHTHTHCFYAVCSTMTMWHRGDAHAKVKDTHTHTHTHTPAVLASVV